MTIFKTKPQLVEGWQFTRAATETPDIIPGWARDKLELGDGGEFVVRNGAARITVLDGQWLMRLAEDELFPLDQEALEEGFDAIH